MTATGSPIGCRMGSNNWINKSTRRLSKATRTGPGRSGVHAAAAAWKLVTPKSGISRASAIPRAAASPTRIPVKLPGPVVTATRPSADASTDASRIARSTIGSNASAWPCGMSRCSTWRTTSPTATATEQANPAQSRARIVGSTEPAGIHGRFRRRGPRRLRGCNDAACSRCRPSTWLSNSGSPSTNPACADKRRRPRNRGK